MIDMIAIAHRDQRGDHRAEHQQQHDQRRRQPELQLTLLQVLGGELVEVVVETSPPVMATSKAGSASAVLTWSRTAPIPSSGSFPSVIVTATAWPSSEIACPPVAYGLYTVCGWSRCPAIDERELAHEGLERRVLGREIG